MIVSLTVVAKPTQSKAADFQTSAMPLTMHAYPPQTLHVPVALRADATTWDPIVTAFGSDAAFVAAGGTVESVPSGVIFNGPDSYLLDGNYSKYLGALALGAADAATVLYNTSAIHALPAFFTQLVRASVAGEGLG